MLGAPEGRVSTGSAPRYRAAIGLALGGLVLHGCGGGTLTDDSDLIHVSCFEMPAASRCSRPVSGFYYDYPSNTCRPVRGGVCDRDWPFRTLRDCVDACGGRPLR